MAFSITDFKFLRFLLANRRRLRFGSKAATHNIHNTPYIRGWSRHMGYGRLTVLNDEFDVVMLHCQSVSCHYSFVIVVWLDALKFILFFDFSLFIVCLIYIHTNTLWWPFTHTWACRILLAMRSPLFCIHLSAHPYPLAMVGPKLLVQANICSCFRICSCASNRLASANDVCISVYAADLCAVWCWIYL